MQEEEEEEEGNSGKQSRVAACLAAWPLTAGSKRKKQQQLDCSTANHHRPLHVGAKVTATAAAPPSPPTSFRHPPC